MHKYFANTRFIGKSSVFLPMCHSTNDIASEMAGKKSAKEGTLIYTDHQISGRGQRGNHWESETGLNLTFSIIFRPIFLDISKIFHLTLFTSLAIHDLLTSYIPQDLFIKWPNDILYKKRKIAGILIENSIRNNKINYSIIGVGININQKKFNCDQAISLSQVCNKDFNLEEKLCEVSACLENRYLQLKSLEFSNMLVNYTSKLYWKDEVHEFKADNHFIGTIRGIDDSGRLLIETDPGIRSYNFNEIKFVK